MRTLAKLANFSLDISERAMAPNNLLVGQPASLENRRAATRRGGISIQDAGKEAPCCPTKRHQDGSILMPGLNRTLLSLNVSESEKGREYWASRSWLSVETAGKIRSADVLVVPWEDFRPECPALFPQGTTDFIAVLKAGDLGAVEIAVDQENYAEIALHADEWRLPTLVCSTVVLPILLHVLSNYVDQWLFSRPTVSIVEEELIVNSGSDICISIRYKGPPADLVTTFRAQAEACLQPKAAKDGKAPAHSNRRRRRK
jgi:hypothetical protein